MRRGMHLFLYSLFALFLISYEVGVGETQTLPTTGECVVGTFENMVVNVRTGPGTVYPTVTAMNSTSVYNVVGRNEDTSWWKINYGGEGWVSAGVTRTGGDCSSVALADYTALIQETPSPDATAEADTDVILPALPTTGECVIATRENQSINVRTGPGTAYPIAGAINSTSIYNVVGHNEDRSWWKINYGGGEGWVSTGVTRTGGDCSSIDFAGYRPPPANDTIGEDSADLPITPVSAQSQSSVSGLNRQVWAFYLSFWAGETTWQWNESVLLDRPTLGYYNSKMPNVADTHIQQAMTAGINAFIVNWWGIDEAVTTTPALVNLLDRAEYNGFEIAVAVDLYPQDFFQTRDQLERSLIWLYENALNHPAYLHYNGQPVLFFAFQDRFDKETWRDLRETIDPDHNAIWIAEGLSACCLYDGVMDGMYAFNMAWTNGDADYYIAERNLIFARGGDIYIPTISPGWNEANIAEITNRRTPTSPRDRADGQFLIDGWNAVLEVESEVILVVSWNEFIENSHIEPSERYGTQSLDILRPLIAEWTGNEPDTPRPLPTGYAITPREGIEEPVNVYAQADRNSAIIGQLQADTVYPLINEGNGLYGIAFDGDVGYVAWETISIIGIE